MMLQGPIVPTMLHRLVEAGAALDRFRVILVGGAGLAPELEWHLDVFQGRERGDQLKGLEDEPNFLPAKPGALVLGQPRELDAVERYAAEQRVIHRLFVEIGVARIVIGQIEFVLEEDQAAGRAAFAIADWTSCAAASISLSRENFRVMIEIPCPLVEFMVSRPEMVENCRSNGVATALLFPEQLTRVFPVLRRSKLTQRRTLF